MSQPVVYPQWNHPVGVLEAAEVSLAHLPTCIRLAEKARDVAEEEWFRALQNFNQTRYQLAYYYHQEERLGIRAAEYKAESQETVIAAGINSRTARSLLLAHRSAVNHLKREFKLKLVKEKRQ